MKFPPIYNFGLLTRSKLRRLFLAAFFAQTKEFNMVIFNQKIIFFSQDSFGLFNQL